jgi:hypothetical protein
MVDRGKRRNSLFAEAAGEFVGEFGSGDGDEFGVMALNLGEEFVEIGASGQGEDSELPGEGLDDAKSLAADRTCGTEDGEGAHGVFSCQFSVVSNAKPFGTRKAAEIGCACLRIRISEISNQISAGAAPSGWLSEPETLAELDSRPM